ncbi:MinD/ParA family ATP-binding protein [Streptomonospora alba]|uniref:MinD/ParA family ATP-binding protein n=1 Tax=Streptomonospora alba TaxID=183763 RepID=UPI00373AEC66
MPPAPQAWAPQHPGGPGAESGGGPAPQPPHGEWRAESAPSGPQGWNAPPPPAPGGPQQPGPGRQQGGLPHPGNPYDQPHGRLYDPYRQPGPGPAGAPAPPPGASGPQQHGRPGPAGGQQSGPQSGFQYSAHFAEGVQPAQQYPGQSGHPETAEDLRAENLVGDKRPGPTKGWRKALHSATFGLIDVGESAAEQRRRELTERARTHVGGGHHRVAVLSLKGGVGKTTTTVALGSMLASLRGDRVLAVDANPDRGTLSDKVRLETAATIRDLLNEKGSISRYADIRGFTSQANSRLEILASDRDPAVSEAFSEEDYREVSWLLEHYYSICLTDCGTGLLHSAMRGVLGLADQIVLVSSASVDGARSASATLDWLEAHQYGSLVRGAVVVLSMVRSGKSSVDLERLEQHFASRCRSVMQVPWDAHLEEGAEVDLERLAPGTRDAYLQLAATVGESFAWPR